MLITTSYDPLPEQLERMERLADKVRKLTGEPTSVRVASRQRYSLPQLRARYGENDLLLVSRERIEYYHEQQPALFFHPSTAAIRVKRLISGEADTLISLSCLQPGDRILDCTAGLGADAIVFSFALGGDGEITALESRVLPFLLLEQGLCSYASDIPGMNEAMRQIRVYHTDHLDYLRAQPNQSFDVVYLDPMFRRPIEQSSSIGAIRELADPRPLSEGTVREAARVARRLVIMKEHRDSGEFARLGFAEVHRSTTKIAYGVIRL